jgi:uncharacterized protein
MPITFELPADDVRRAARFYREVFGWTATELPEVEFTLLTEPSPPGAPPRVVGGIAVRNAHVRAPVPIVSVPSIDAHLPKVEANGGVVLTRRERVGDFGFSAYVKDPEGNVVCLWEDPA